MTLNEGMNEAPQSPTPFFECVMPSHDTLAFRKELDKIETALSDQGLSGPDIFSIIMALEEAGINGMKHGNKLDPTKVMTLKLFLYADRVEATVQDEGEGFDPEDVPDPTDPENTGRECGRGLLMMRHYMKEVIYSDNGRRVFMMRKLVADELGVVMNSLS